MGVLDRLRNAWEIFKLSFRLLGRDKSLAVIPVVILLSSILFIIPVLLFFISEISSSGAVLVYGLIFLFLFYLWMTFLSAAQAWMVHEVVEGKDTTVLSGIKRAFHNLLDIIAFASVLVLIFVISALMRRKGGRIGQFGASTFEYLTGIVGKLVLPAMIITERSFGEAVKQMKDSIKALPEIATYEIGIRPLTFLAIITGVFITFILAFSFGGFAAIVFLILWALALILLSIYINATYYTLVYMALIEGRRVKELKAIGL